MKRITFLLTFVFTSIIAQSQIFFEYDFRADTVAKQLAGRNGWSASTDAGFPGTGLCAGAICENAKVKLDSLTYKGYGSFAVVAIPRFAVIATFGVAAATRDELSNFDADRVARSIEAESNLFFLGAQYREPGESVNHSCEPNLWNA